MTTKPTKNKKTPMRRCVGCMESKPKNELIRIVYTPLGDLMQDLNGKVDGRGVYLCKDEACIEKAIKRKALPRSLKKNVTSEQLERLFKEMDGQLGKSETEKPAIKEPAAYDEREDT